MRSVVIRGLIVIVTVATLMLPRAAQASCEWNVVGQWDGMPTRVSMIVEAQDGPMFSGRLVGADMNYRLSGGLMQDNDVVYFMAYRADGTPAANALLNVAPRGSQMIGILVWMDATGRGTSQENMGFVGGPSTNRCR